MKQVRKQIEIINRLGLHARAAAQLVQLAARFESEVTLVKDDQEVNGKSILNVMMLAAAQGSTIEVSADGPDAEAAMAAIEKLIADRFNEDE
jgi:phosphocarrier protein